MKGFIASEKSRPDSGLYARTNGLMAADAGKILDKANLPQLHMMISGLAVKNGGTPGERTKSSNTQVPQNTSEYKPFYLSSFALQMLRDNIADAETLASLSVNCGNNLFQKDEFTGLFLINVLLDAAIEGESVVASAHYWYPQESEEQIQKQLARRIALYKKATPQEVERTFRLGLRRTQEAVDNLETYYHGILDFCDKYENALHDILESCRSAKKLKAHGLLPYSYERAEYPKHAVPSNARMPQFML